MNAAPRPFLPNVCQECQNEAPPRVYKVKVFAASLRPVTDLRGAVRDREEEGDTQPHSFQNDDEDPLWPIQNQILNRVPPMMLQNIQFK